MIAGILELGTFYEHRSCTIASFLCTACIFIFFISRLGYVHHALRAIIELAWKKPPASHRTSKRLPYIAFVL